MKINDYTKEGYPHISESTTFLQMVGFNPADPNAIQTAGSKLKNAIAPDTWMFPDWDTDMLFVKALIYKYGAREVNYIQMPVGDYGPYDLKNLGYQINRVFYSNQRLWKQVINQLNSYVEMSDDPFAMDGVSTEGSGENNSKSEGTGTGKTTHKSSSGSKSLTDSLSEGNGSSTSGTITDTTGKVNGSNEGTDDNKGVTGIGTLGISNNPDVVVNQGNMLVDSTTGGLTNHNNKSESESTDHTKADTTGTSESTDKSKVNTESDTTATGEDGSETSQQSTTTGTSKTLNKTTGNLMMNFEKLYELNQKFAYDFDKFIDQFSICFISTY